MLVEFYHIEGLGKASATYGTRAKRGTWNDFQWHAEWIEIQYMILCMKKPVWS
jgi:hypothetical protein